MAILKIKDETGKFVDIPAIQGAPGKDGAIQYEAGENITIDGNVISASGGITLDDVKAITGELTDLSTEDKSNLVHAINEVASGSGSGSQEIFYLYNGSYKHSVTFTQNYGLEEIQKVSDAYESGNKPILVVRYNDGIMELYPIMYKNGDNLEGKVMTIDNDNIRFMEKRILITRTLMDGVYTVKQIATVSSSFNMLASKTYVDDAVVAKQDVLTAGENITIDGNVISANRSPIYLFKTKLSLKNAGSSQGGYSDEKPILTEIINSMYTNGDTTGSILLQGADTLTALLHLNQETDYTIQRQRTNYLFRGIIPNAYNSNTKIRMNVGLSVTGAWVDNVFTCTGFSLFNGTDYDLSTFATKKYVDDSIAAAITTTLEGGY